jgi:hypothetical protein
VALGHQKKDCYPIRFCKKSDFDKKPFFPFNILFIYLFLVFPLSAASVLNKQTLFTAWKTQSDTSSCLLTRRLSQKKTFAEVSQFIPTGAAGDKKDSHC